MQKKTYTSCNVYKISDPIVIIIYRWIQQQAIFLILIILIQHLQLLYNNIQIAWSFSTPVNKKTQMYVDVSSTIIQKAILTNIIYLRPWDWSVVFDSTFSDENVVFNAHATKFPKPFQHFFVQKFRQCWITKSPLQQLKHSHDKI